MTCIIGFVENDKVWVGGDSCASTSRSKILVREPKVFQNGEFVFGVAGSFRVMQLLQYSFSAPAQRSEETDMEYMVTRFIDALKDCLRRGGAMIIEEGMENMEGYAAFAVAYRGNLYAVYRDFQVLTVKDNYVSLGSGSLLALGSLHTTKDETNLTTQERIEKALKAAATHDPYVQEPFVVYKQEVERKAALTVENDWGKTLISKEGIHNEQNHPVS